MCMNNISVHGASEWDSLTLFFDLNLVPIDGGNMRDEWMARPEESRLEIVNLKHLFWCINHDFSLSLLYSASTPREISSKLCMNSTFQLICLFSQIENEKSYRSESCVELHNVNNEKTFSLLLAGLLLYFAARGGGGGLERASETEHDSSRQRASILRGEKRRKKNISWSKFMIPWELDHEFRGTLCIKDC